MASRPRLPISPLEVEAYHAAAGDWAEGPWAWHTFVFLLRAGRSPVERSLNEVRKFLPVAPDGRPFDLENPAGKVAAYAVWNTAKSFLGTAVRIAAVGFNRRRDPRRSLRPERGYVGAASVAFLEALRRRFPASRAFTLDAFTLLPAEGRLFPKPPVNGRLARHGKRLARRLPGSSVGLRLFRPPVDGGAAGEPSLVAPAFLSLAGMIGQAFRFFKEGKDLDLAYRTAPAWFRFSQQVLRLFTPARPRAAEALASIPEPAEALIFIRRRGFMEVSARDASPFLEFDPRQKRLFPMEQA